MGKKRELTVEDKTKSYAKYYYMELTKPDQMLINKVNQKTIDPATALKFKDRNDLLKPGYLASEIGYCKMPDGAGYVSNLLNMPGVTAEMFDWWFAWHPVEPLRYQIWDSEDHYGVQVSPEHRKQLLDTSIPIRERNWGVTHYVKEEIGLPWYAKLVGKLVGKDPSNIVIPFVSPSNFGFDMNQFKSPNVETAICAALGENSGMCHFIRKIDKGIELRTRFWFGPQMKTPLFFLKALNLHAIKEFTHLAQILPKIYAEESGNGTPC